MSIPDVTIVDAAVAVPRTRVNRRSGLIAHRWYDEDATTLAADAALRLLDDRPDIHPAGLIVATVSSPFAEGGIAQVLAEMLGLAAGELVVQEHGGTTAATGGAIVAAMGLAAAGPVLLVAVDTRRDHRGRAMGDAAVALLLDREGDVARITHLESRADLLRDHWRLDGDAITSSADRSFLKASARPDDAEDALVATTPTRPTLDRVGAPGCAALPLAMLLALGPDVSGSATTTAGGVTHRFTVTAGPAAADAAARARAVVAGGEEGPAPHQPDVDGFDPYSSQPRLRRERAQDLRLVGQRDPASGEVLYPPVPASSATDLEEFRLGRKGTVLTHTRDHIFPQGAPLSMAVVELDGGGRFFGQVADGRTVQIGQDVELTPRRLHDGGGIPHYFWKVRPVAPPTGDSAVTA